jgi:hypothetical protein
VRQPRYHKGDLVAYIHDSRFCGHITAIEPTSLKKSYLYHLQGEQESGWYPEAQLVLLQSSLPAKQFVQFDIGQRVRFKQQYLGTVIKVHSSANCNPITYDLHLDKPDSSTPDSSTAHYRIGVSSQDLEYLPSNFSETDAESVYRDALAATLQNQPHQQPVQCEANTEAGRIDILTATEVIEVKWIKQWKAALGQVLVYAHYHPDKHPKIHLYGSASFSELDTIYTHCQRFNVRFTWEPPQHFRLMR